MLPWAALLGTLGLNVWQHLHGRPTLCSTARRHLPRPAFLAAWAALSGWLVPHYLRGFRPLE
jgi:hypothetical protein